MQTREWALSFFKLKENAFRKRESFKENVYEREQVLRNVSVFMCRKAPSFQEEENPTHVGDPDYLRG